MASDVLLSLHAMDLTSYDFTTTMGWETFYQDCQSKDDDLTAAATTTTKVTTFEWHDSVALDEVIAHHTTAVGAKTCLIPGCGNDVQLPERLLLSLPPTAQVHCVDTSSTCLEQLKRHLGDDHRVTYHCNDAIDLLDLQQQQRQQQQRQQQPPFRYDVIFDKGLMDAIMCGEGWDKPLSSLFAAAAKCLTPNQGTYLLISYRLSNSTKRFLQEVGEREGLTWTFDLPESNKRVSVSKALKR